MGELDDFLRTEAEKAAARQRRNEERNEAQAAEITRAKAILADGVPRLKETASGRLVKAYVLENVDKEGIREFFDQGTHMRPADVFIIDYPVDRVGGPSWIDVYDRGVAVDMSCELYDLHRITPKDEHVEVGPRDFYPFGNRYKAGVFHRRRNQRKVGLINGWIGRNPWVVVKSLYGRSVSIDVLLQAMAQALRDADEGR